MDLPTSFPSDLRLDEKPDSPVQTWKLRVMSNRLSIFILSLVGIYIFISEACELAHERFLLSSFTREGAILGSLELGSLPSLIDASIEDLAAGLESGIFTSVDLVTAYTARIEEVNSILKAVTEINPDALEIAAALDAARASGTVHGPLYGIPILIKNNIATSDKMNNTAGSYALLGAQVPEDSTMVVKLRKAGAIILGKANLSQWANYRSSNSSNGWSSHGGQVEGAYYPQQDACGSSSGSGVAASLGLAAATLGTETDGSILCPSNHNNIVGIKPTVGLTSRHLVIPISEHQDTIGPMARTVKDAAYILSAIVGHDTNDNYTSSIPFEANKMPNYVSACDLSALKGKRIGVPRNLIDTSSEYSPIIASFNESLDILREAGATIIDEITLSGYDSNKRGGWYETNVIKIDFVANLKSYFSKLSHNPQNITSLLDMMRFTQTHSSEEWPQRDTQLWEGALNLTANGTLSLSGALWANYTAQLYLAGTLGIMGALENYTLDALVVPSLFASSLPARLGSPVISVPMGRYPIDTPVVKNGFGNLVARAPNMPFGISFMAERFSEEKLIGLAYAFEQRTLIREKVKPYIEPKTELGDVVWERKKGKGPEERKSSGHGDEGTMTQTNEGSKVDI